MKRIIFGMITLMMFLTISQTYANKIVSWTFVKVEQNPFCKKSSNPGTSCSYQTFLELDDYIVNLNMSAEEIHFLSIYFNVPTPAELKGKMFYSKETDASIALEALILEQKYGDKYIPPSKEELYERAAIAMSKMKCPDFSDIDSKTLSNAFLKTGREHSGKEDWMQNLKERISKLSNGQVQLLGGDSKKFPVRINGPADYLLLTNGQKNFMIIIGPYSQPITFYTVAGK